VKEIDLSSLAAGQVTQHEYYGENGDLLIARGVYLTEKHLDLLLRRNVFSLYIKDDDDDEAAVKEILSTDYTKGLEALPLDGPDNAPSAPAFAPPPKALSEPELQRIKKGEDGFKQLSESKRTLDLDYRLQEGRYSDRPVGIAFREKLQQISTRERSEEYKKRIPAIYADALRRTSSILTALANGKRIEYSAPRAIVEQLLRVFSTDMCFLVNVVAQQQKSDEHLFNHSLNVCIYAVTIAAAYGYNQHQVVEIGAGALLHDVGMLLVPNDLRLKKGKLDKDEWFEIMKHPILGLHLLEKIDRMPDLVAYMAYQCHERENGCGYPKQRSSRFIHTYAKICAIADMFEAFSAPRPYREAHIPFKALELVIKASRQGLVAGDLVKSFVQFLSLFPVGSIVELNNRSIGKVIRNNPLSPSKPIVAVLFDPDGKRLTGANSYEEDLAANLSLSIVKAHPPSAFPLKWTDGF
jgi:HD-GYP domain-containing protein (c-di-GMP phosphodiesterase class II)